MDDTSTQTKKIPDTPALIGLTVTVIVVIVLTGVNVGLRGRSTVFMSTEVPISTTIYGGKRPLLLLNSIKIFTQIVNCIMVGEQS